MKKGGSKIEYEMDQLKKMFVMWICSLPLLLVCNRIWDFYSLLFMIMCNLFALQDLNEFVYFVLLSLESESIQSHLSELHLEVIYWKEMSVYPLFWQFSKNLGLEMRIVSQFSQLSLDPIYIFFQTQQEEEVLHW